MMDYLIDFEALITALLEDSGIKIPEGPVITLTGVTEGSNILLLGVLSVVLPVVSKASNAIANNSIDNLPSNAIDAMRKITTKTIAKNQAFTIAAIPEYQVTEATISPSFSAVIAEHQARLVTGDSRIYGRCVGVAGERIPHADIKLIEGHTIRISVTQDLAIQLAKNLYEEVCIEGEAIWKVPGWKIVKFTAASVSTHPRIDPAKAMEILRGSSSRYLKEINPETFVDDLRYGEK